MKTIEEISHKICDKYALTIDLSVPIADAIKEAQKWIPIDDELPTLKKEIYPILGKYENNDVEIFYIENNDDIADCVKCFTHWRPIELK